MELIRVMIPSNTTVKSMPKYSGEIKQFLNKKSREIYQNISLLMRTISDFFENNLARSLEQNKIDNVDNLQKLTEEITTAIATTRATSSEHTLCYLDIDRFQKIIQIYGDRGAETLLNQLLNILQEYLYATDTLAYLGKDKIALLWRECSLTEAQKQAKILKKVIESISFQWGNREILGLSVSIGLTDINSKDRDSNTVLDRAKIACYRAKVKGRNPIEVY